MSSMRLSAEEQLTICKRDRRAEARDRAAEKRDRVADDRDAVADGHDRAAGFSVSERRRATGERDTAARDRARSARDREQAAQDRRQAARERAQAGVDALTGALLRDRGLTDLQREIDRARRADGRLVLAFVDVDGLKAINDAKGHAAGDQLLRDVAGALRTGLRSYDHVIRCGGDEFLCALPHTGIEQARRRFAEVARNLTQKTPSASVSIGLAALVNADTRDELIARADAALYAERRSAATSIVGGRPRHAPQAHLLSLSASG
jgi:diguanylate cyclase (GGDEF)-like protein